METREVIRGTVTGRWAEQILLFKYVQPEITDMKLLTWGIIAVTLLAVLFAGCTSPQTTTPTPVSPVPIPPVITATPAAPATPSLPSNMAGNWKLTTMAIQDGSAVTYPTTAITLAFSSDGTVYGNGGCNNYNGPFTLLGTTTPKGQGITIGPLASTKMYCATTSEQESTYLTMLQQTAAYDVDTTQLSLTAPNQNVLIFQRPSSIPTQTMGMLPA